MTSTALGIAHDDKVDAAWVLCLLALRQHPDVETTIMVEGGPGNFDVARNKVARHFLANTAATHLLTIDTDMMFRPAHYEALRDRGLGVVSGTYYINDTPPRPCFGRYDANGRIQTVTEWDSDLIEVDAAGGGFMLISREALLAMGGLSDTERQGPWYRMDRTGPAGQVLEPDHAFCSRAKEAGYAVHIDTSVVLGHIKPHVLGWAP